MSDILKQIQELQEQFDNLFEVDGLGDPAVDVPPSQNKIKRDRKTKDGKVEVVSVEDELFPYEGNKREQFRQKVIATINNMIQGTATLEDLLQLVRQKKAPLKEAMEILECLIDEKLSPLQKRDMVQAIKFLKATDKWKDNDDNVVDFLRDDAKNTVEYGFKHRHDKDVDLKKRPSAHFEEKTEQKKAPLKEALEIMEAVINELYPDTVKSALHAHNKKTIELEDKVNKRIGEIFKKHGIKGNTYSAATAEDRQKAVETEKEIKEDPEIKDLHNQQEKRAKKNELYRNAIRKARKSPVKEAFDLMEEIINEISDKTANSFLEKRVINALNAWYNDDKLNKKEDDAVKALIKRKARQGAELSDDEKKRIEETFSIVEAIINELNTATVNNALNKRIDQSVEADDKDRAEFNNILKIKDRDKRVKAYAEFKKRTYDRFNKENKKLDVYAKFAKKHPEVIESVEKYVDGDGNTHELEFSIDNSKGNKYKFDHKINGKSVVSATDSEPNANYERKHAVKNYGLKKVEEALSLMEEIINEVSVGALARATENNFNKRREVAKDSTEKAKKAYDSYERQSKEHPEDEEALYKAVSKLGNVAHKDREKASHANDLANLNLPKDSKVPANKLFNAADKTYNGRGKEVDKALEKGKGRGDKEFDSSMKKYARAVDLAVADPVVSRRTNEALIEEADHHANSKNPVVKITDKNYQVASGKSLPGPFNKNHVGQYIVYNKDTDASYLVTPDNWKKSKIKRDLERQGKFYEALEEVLSVLEKFTEGDKKEAARKVIDSRKREYLSKYANVLDAADIDGSENVPDGDLKDLDRAEKRYKHAEEVAKKLDELFDRPDLLDDIDTMLGSPVKKAKDKLLKQIFEPKKEKKEEKKETCLKK